jgi:hypothetical protein
MAGKCGKVCYPTRAAAEFAMRKVPLTLGHMAPRAYRCGRCRAWHFTTAVRARRRS